MNSEDSTRDTLLPLRRRVPTGYLFLLAANLTLLAAGVVRHRGHAVRESELIDKLITCDAQYIELLTQWSVAHEANDIQQLQALSDQAKIWSIARAKNVEQFPELAR